MTSIKIDTNARLEEKEDFNADISGVRILLVEDNELNAEIAEFILTENGAKVETVKNGLEAVQHFEASEPGTYDVILMDVMMPVRKLQNAEQLLTHCSLFLL